MTSFLSLSPATPDTPVSPTIDFAMSSFYEHDKVKDILKSFFRSFKPKFQKKLIQLSLFEDKFDTKAANAVMEDLDFVHSTHNLQYFEVRNLIEVSSVMQSGAVNPYDHADVRYILHTITLNFLKKKQQNEMWRKVVDEAEHRFCDHFQGVLLDVALTFTKNVIKGHQMYEQNETHLKKLIRLKEKQGYLVKLEKPEEFKKQVHIISLYERFLLTDERVNYFESQARIAETKSEKLTQCYYMLWMAESYFQLQRYDLIASITEKVDKLLTVLEKKHDTPMKNMHCIRALYKSIKGRWFHHMQKFSHGLILLTEAYSRYNQFLGPAHPATSKVANLIGSTYFSMGDYKKALSVCRN